MPKAVALTRIWNHAYQQIVNIGDIFDMSSDAIASLVRIGAAFNLEGDTMFSPYVEYRDAFESSLTVANTPVFLPASVKSQRRAFIQAQGGTIRYTFVGTPTSSTGYILNDGDNLMLESQLEVNQFRAVSVSGSVTLWTTGFS